MGVKERISKLISVKSIVTIILTIVFAYLAVTGKISEDNFMAIFVMIISFFFGTQAIKEHTK